MENRKQLLISELIEITMAKLEQLRYSPKYRYALQTLYRKLLTYANNMGIIFLTEQFAADFLKNVFAIDAANPPDRDYAVRGIAMLLDLQTIGIIRKRRKPNINFRTALSYVFDSFIMATSGNMKQSTLETYQRYIRIFEKHLDTLGIKSLLNLNTQAINAFILSLARYSGAFAKRTIAVLSSFLSYAYEKSYTPTDWSQVCMSSTFYQDRRIPSVFSTAEIDLMLKQINRNTAEGKRDYALLLLASRSALRSCDIIALKLESIRFDTNTIEITQCKTGKTLVLPLMKDVGMALIDYLHNGRPRVSSEYVFLRIRAPFEPYAARTNNLVKKYMQLAKIPNLEKRRPGLCALRHSLASRMLETGISLYEIKGFLGHETTATTMNYLKIDNSLLRKCALEVPVDA